MTQQNGVYDDLEHQRLVAKCHSLVAAIANRPGSTKLLKGIMPTLETYAGYKRRKLRVKTSTTSGGSA